MPVKPSQEAEDRVDIFGGVYIKRRGRTRQIYMPINEHDRTFQKAEAETTAPF